MLGEIDLNLKPEETIIYITKPSRRTLSEVPEAYGINHKVMLTELNTLTFNIPYYIEENNLRIRNKNADLIRERYHIKYKTQGKFEWYIVINIEDNGEANSDYKSVYCEYLPIELAGKYISGYQEDSKNARQVLNDILRLTSNWSIGSMDADFELSRRSWDFSTKTTLLEAVYAVFERYNAILEWDTENRLINMIKPEFHGINRLGTLSREKYLKSVNKKSDSESIITRLRPKGKDGLGIERVNEGSPYIEDFSFWMYPFERDEQKNTLQHSHYMSDDLCHKILDFKELKENYKDSYKQYVEQRDVLTSTLSRQRVELITLENEMAAITQIRLSQQFNDLMFLERFQYTGSSKTIRFPHPEDGIAKFKPGMYGLFVWIANASNISMSANGVGSTVQSGTWVLANKVGINPDQLNIAVSGSGQSEIFLQSVSLSETEYNTLNNGPELVKKYSFHQKEMEIATKRAEISGSEAQIKVIDAEINAINNILSPINNFTQELLEELDAYILEEEYTDETLIDENDVLTEGNKKFQELKIPQLEIEIDIIDFMKCIEEQRNWRKLYLGDKIRIKYDVFGDFYVEAKIIAIEYDHDAPNIRLTIANFKDLSTNQKALEKYIYDMKGKTDGLYQDKDKWNQAIVDNSEFGKIFERFWDKTTEQINMAINQTVTINDNGITVYDENDPLRFIRITNGAIGLTRSGALRFETALTPDGSSNERIMTTTLSKVVILI